MSMFGLIPAAGKGMRFGEISKRYPKCLLPYENKPILFHNIETLIESGCDRVVVVCHKDQEEQFSGLLEFFKLSDCVELVSVDGTDGPGDSIARGLGAVLDCQQDASVEIILSDIVPDKEQYKKFSEWCQAISADGFTFNEVSDWERWCMVDTDRKVFIDKPKEKPHTTKAMSGCYIIRSASLFLSSYREAQRKFRERPQGEFQISDLLTCYLDARKSEQNEHNTQFAKIGIKDFGTLSEYLENRSVALSRDFNEVVIQKDTVTKTCKTNPEKIYKEACWLQMLPKDLLPYTPRVYDCSPGSYTMERVDLPTLRELFVFADNTTTTWEPIIRTLLDVCLKMRANVGSQDSKPLDAFLSRVRERAPRACGVYEATMRQYLSDVYDKHEIIKQSSVYHGDFCMSNIFYNTDRNSIKMIDPRGEMFGSFYYDLAKLMHSFVGMYDIVDSEMYVAHENIVMLYTSKKGKIAKMFIDILREYISDDEFWLVVGICAGLFLTMIPLHYHNATNQATFYQIHGWLFECFQKRRVPVVVDDMAFTIDPSATSL